MVSAPIIQGKVLKALMMSMDTAILPLLITDFERARTCRIALTVPDEDRGPPGTGAGRVEQRCISAYPRHSANMEQ